MSSTASVHTQLDDSQLVEQLRRKVKERLRFEYSFIYEIDPHSAPPADLVAGLDHDPGTGQGDDKRKVWYFSFRPHLIKSAKGKTRRRRLVQGGGVWHQDDTAHLDGASMTRLAYMSRGRNGTRLGWCMFEIELTGAAGQQLVLYKLHRSTSHLFKDEPGVVAPLAAPPPAPPSFDVAPEAVPVPAPASFDAAPLTAPPPAPASFDAPPLAAPPPVPGSFDVAPQVAPLPVPAFSGVAPPTDWKSDPRIDESKPDPRIYNPFKRRWGYIPITTGWALIKTSAVRPVTVMKFGASSMKTTKQIMEMLNFTAGAAVGESAVIVLSALGDTTTNLRVATLKALSYGRHNASKIHEVAELALIRQFYLSTIDELGLDRTIVTGAFDELGRTLEDVVTMEVLTAKNRNYLDSFGEYMCTTVFSAYLNKHGKETGEEWKAYAVETCGRGASDLTATTIAKKMGAREIQVLKDVDGVMTCDPTVCGNAILQPHLTFDEAAEIGIFCAQSMRLAMEGGISIIVKNSCRPEATGTMITKTRDINKHMLTSIVLKHKIAMLNIKSKSVPAQSNFITTCFSAFENVGILFQCLSTGEGQMSLIVAPSKLSSHELVHMELGIVLKELREYADVDRQDKSLVSLVGNAHESPAILEKIFIVLRRIDVKVQMTPYILAKEDEQVMKISLVVNDIVAKRCVQALHSEFFGNGLAEGAENERPALPLGSCRSGDKRKFEGDHTEAPHSFRQGRADTDRSSVVEETKFSGDKIDGDLAKFFHGVRNDTIGPVKAVQDLGENLDRVMNTGQPAVQLEQPVNVEQYLASAFPNAVNGYGIQPGDFNGVVPLVQPQQQVLREVGESSGGAAGFLEESEHSYQAIKDQNHVRAMKDMLFVKNPGFVGDHNVLNKTAGRSDIKDGWHGVLPDEVLEDLSRHVVEEMPGGSNGEHLPDISYQEFVGVGGNNNTFLPNPPQLGYFEGNDSRYPRPTGGYFADRQGRAGYPMPAAGLAASGPEDGSPLFNDNECAYLDDMEDFSVSQLP